MGFSTAGSLIAENEREKESCNEGGSCRQSSKSTV